MNQLFAQATRNIAFSLQLSKLQCHALLRVMEFELEAKERGIEPFPPSWKKAQDEKSSWTDWWTLYRGHLCVIDVSQLRALEGKGLVFWHRNAEGTASGFGGFTKAGRLTTELLIEAGMSVDSTVTPLIQKRLGFEMNQKAIAKKEQLNDHSN